MRWLFYAGLAVFGVVAAAILLAGLAVVLTYPTLPSLEALTDYRPKVPLRVYSADGDLLGEFGEERRAVISFAAVPKPLVQAILAAEDERFYQHRGVDYIGVLRAAWSNFASGETRQGASTITMQVARNFFLSKEKTFIRKFNEALLSFKIEGSLSKDQILELYINQIYLGQRAYGFAAAARCYSGKNLDQLSLSEMAMLAGLPKAPSRYNPIVNPKRARARQAYVLRRMRELGFITDDQYRAALDAPVAVHPDQGYAVHADYVAEMVRQLMFDRYGEDAYARGLRVYTTIRRDHQEAAYASVRRGVLDYDQRHGYRGPEGYLELPEGDARDEAIDDALQEVAESDDLLPAVVLQASPKLVRARIKGGVDVEVRDEGLKFAQRALAASAPERGRIRPGALIRVQKDDKRGWQIVEMPLVEAAMVSLDPNDGALLALVGGFDFRRSKFNHVTQALRQPGSSFKPFVYSAALEKGFTPATIVNDAPIVVDPATTGGEPWEPKNFDGEYAGPLRLRMGLAKSKNLVSIRVLQTIGTAYAQDYVTRFGFSRDRIPPYLTMALGAGSATPYEMVRAYAVFANQGYLVTPYLIERIEDGRGQVLARANPERAGENADPVIDPRNAFIMNTMLRDVIRQGTATRAKSLGRDDLAGKTGTTNDQVDAWFCGFNRNLAAVAWIGYDLPKNLGGNETGARAALPMWIDYMGHALKGQPEAFPAPPEGVVTVKIDPETGLRTDGAHGLVEFFLAENLPPAQASDPLMDLLQGGGRPSDQVREQLF